MKRRPIRINALSIAKLMRYLQEVPSNTRELVEVSGLCLGTVRSYMRAMHAEGAVYIADWEACPRGKYCIKVFAFGQGKDAKKPVGSNSKRAKQYRMRLAQLEIQKAMCPPAAP